MDWLLLLFDTTGFPARWYCGGGWTTFHGSVHIAADLATWGAYTAIPLVLAYFIRRREDLPFTRLFWLFCAFIFACGTVHLIEAVIFWKPIYRLSALAKVVTAVVSWATVAALIPIAPKALALPGLKSVNDRLREEIAERERAEAELRTLANELAASNQVLEQFARAASHDMQEPLRMIRSFGDLLGERCADALDDKGKRYLGFMLEGAKRMNDQIEGLLVYSRTSDDATQRADAREALEGALANLAAAIEESGAEVEVASLPDTLPVGIGPLTGLFQNLLSNAIKYREAGAAPKITVSAERGEASWRVTVRDRGIGIDPESAERIFLMFKRAHTAQEYPGTGVGLALCRRIVTRAGGRIWAEPDPEGGSSFTFELPCASRAAEEVQGSESRP